jgi:hypothetical protein
MSQPLTGLTGLTGWVDATPEATAEERLGGTADPRHGNIGEVATPYPWEVFPGESHGPYGLENDLLGMDICSFVEPAGILYQDPTADQSPIRSHGAPWPKGVPSSVTPDGTEAWRDQIIGIHESNLGGSREMLYEPSAFAVQDNWVEISETEAGQSNQVPIPGQIMTGGVSGWGSRDRVQSNAQQNQYGFDSAHMHRRYAAGSIPGNFMWMEPGSRPMVKSIPGTAKIPVGVDSPFAGQDIGQSYSAQGSALLVLPTGYVAPPDPALAPSYPQGEAPSVDLW